MLDEQELIGYLAGGVPVFYKPVWSRLRINDNVLRQEVLSQISPDGRRIVKQVDFNTVVGYTHRVSTMPDDQIAFARESGYSDYLRFVLNRNPEPSHSAVAVLQYENQDGQTYYVLRADYIGTKGEPWPWDAHLNPATRTVSQKFWESHAKVAASDTMIHCYRCGKLFRASHAVRIYSVLACPQCEADRRTLLGADLPPAERIPLNGWGLVEVPVLAAR